MIGIVEPTTRPVVAAQPTAQRPITQEPKEGQLGPLEVRIAAELEDAESIRRYRNEVSMTCLGLCITVPIASTVGITLGTVVSPLLGATSATLIYCTGAIATCGAIIGANRDRPAPLAENV